MDNKNIGNQFISGLKYLYSRAKDTLSDLKEIDSLLTEIGKLNDRLTSSDLSRIRDQAFETASLYGRTAGDYLNAVREALRAGHENAEEIANLALILQSAQGSSPTEALEAVLTDYSRYENMLRDYAGGSGSLAAEARSATDSWEGSLNRLANTWTQTVGNIADSKLVTSVTNGLNQILSLVNAATDRLGSLGSIGALSGLFMNLKGIGERTAFRW